MGMRLGHGYKTGSGMGMGLVMRLGDECETGYGTGL